MSKKPASLKIETRALKAALKDVSGAVESRNAIPILTNLLLESDRSALTISATDLDMMVARRVTAAGHRFKTTVHARTLTALVDKLPPGAEVTLSVSDGKLEVSALRASFTLPTLPADEFPDLSEAETPVAFEIDALTLNAALARVAHAVSTEETRYYLNGVFAHVVEGELRLAATDGHRLARHVLPLPEGAEALPDVIVPRKAVRLLSALLDRYDGAIEVDAGPRRLRLSIGETTLTTKVIDGTFPDYARVIPTGNDKKIAIDRADLIAAIGRVTTVSSDKTRAVRAAVATGKLTLSVSSAEHGQAREELACESAGGPVEAGFNARYLLDALGQLSASNVEIEARDAASPIILRDSADSPTLFLLMPMRV